MAEVFEANGKVSSKKCTNKLKDGTTKCDSFFEGEQQWVQLFEEMYGYDEEFFNCLIDEKKEKTNDPLQ